MMRILVTGASGLLGLNFALRYHTDHQVSGVVHRHPLRNPPFRQIVADLSDSQLLEAVLEQTQPEVVLHCAALANLDECERNPQRAFQVNVELPEMLARCAVRDGFRLVHLSTDAVFDGQRGEYTEEDTPNPLSVYACTKWQAEQRVLETCPQALVARVNFYGWSLSGQRSLGEFFFYNLKEGRPVKGFTDVIFCPLEATQLADLLLRLVEKEAAGLFHVVSRECQSKYQFGVNLARRFGLDERLIEPVSVMEGGLVARRSPNLSLRTDKLRTALGEEPPGQAAALDRFYQLYVSGYPRQVRSLADGRSSQAV
ncbi:MAG: SDR family oxidoreductase [Chloroflexota bacterium]